MSSPVKDLAQLRLDNALLLFEEFVRATARHADAATLRGLERRFAERLQIQASYWSQIKARSRQIGERLARQFELLCHKPAGWMDQNHSAVSGSAVAEAPEPSLGTRLGSPGGYPLSTAGALEAYAPRDDDERFILGLVLTYYRRHPQRARTRLLDLLGEVLTPEPQLSTNAAPPATPGLRPGPGPVSGPLSRRAPPAPAPTPPSENDLWALSQQGVAPLKRKR